MKRSNGLLRWAPAFISMALTLLTVFLILVTFALFIVQFGQPTANMYEISTAFLKSATSVYLIGRLAQYTVTHGLLIGVLLTLASIVFNFIFVSVCVQLGKWNFPRT